MRGTRTTRNVYAMSVKSVAAGLFKRWPIVVIAASVAITVVWIGALLWILAELLVGFPGI
jgi:hypothetical protein